MALVMALGPSLSDVPYIVLKTRRRSRSSWNDPHPGNALCDLAVNGIDEFLDGLVEDKVGRLLRFSLGPDLADLPRDVLEQPD